MTPERLRRMRQLHAVCVEAGCRVSAEKFGECLDEIERLQAINAQQAEALRGVVEACERYSILYMSEEGREAFEAVRTALELEGK